MLTKKEENKNSYRLEGLVELLNKNSKKFMVSIFAIISVFLLGLTFYYWYYNYYPIAKVGDYNITRNVVRSNIPKNEKYLKSLKGEKADLEKEMLNILLEEKATEFEANKLGLTVSDSEIDADIKKANYQDDLDVFYSKYSDIYGWDRTELRRQSKIKLLKLKVEEKVVNYYDVQFLFARADAEPKDGETPEQMKTKASEIVSEAKNRIVKGASLPEYERELENTTKTWKGTAVNSGEQNRLNDETEQNSLINKALWPEIKKLSKAGDQTAVLDYTDRGGYYIFFYLNSKNVGQFNSLDEFYDSFRVENKFTRVMERIFPKAFACSNYLNDHVNTTDELNLYRISSFQVQLRNSISGALITGDADATIELNNAESSDGDCSSSWCLMNRTDKVIDGTDGQTTFGDTCCQFTYAIYVHNLDGYSYSYTKKTGQDSGYNTQTESYPPYFNGNNGVDNMNGDLYFNPEYTLTVNISGNGSGVVQSPLLGINCSYNGSSKSGSCSNSYTDSKNLAGTRNTPTTSLTTSADTSSNFGGFSGSCSGTGACDLTMNQNRTVNVVFTKKTYSVNVTAGAGGSASANPTTVSHGGSSAISATANGGYTFSSWSGDCAGQAASFTMSNIISNKSCTANFSQIVAGCTPLAPQTQTLSCPAGQSGSITQRRDSYCPGPNWGAWYTTSNTCYTPPAPTASCSASSFVATPSTINSGLTTVLNWIGSFQNATGTWRINGAVQTPGFTAGPLYANTTFALTGVSDLGTQLCGPYNTAVTVNQTPSITCSVTPVGGNIPLTARFNYSLMGGGTLSGVSIFKDGSIFKTVNPTASPFYFSLDQPGKYTFTANGNFGSDSCSNAAVTVKNPSDGSGGEVRP